MSTIEILQIAAACATFFIAAVKIVSMVKAQAIKNKIKKTDRKAKETLKEQLYLNYIKTKDQEKK